MPNTTDCREPLRSFVIRVWCDDDLRLRGQLIEPFHDWRQPFATSTELIGALLHRFQDSSNWPVADPDEEK